MHSHALTCTHMRSHAHKSHIKKNTWCFVRVINMKAGGCFRKSCPLKFLFDDILSASTLSGDWYGGTKNSIDCVQPLYIVCKAIQGQFIHPTTPRQAAMFLKMDFRRVMEKFTFPVSTKKRTVMIGSCVLGVTLIATAVVLISRDGAMRRDAQQDGARLRRDVDQQTQQTAPGATATASYCSK